MNRIVERLRERVASSEPAILPYFTAGFPDDETVAELIRRADALGAPVVELGFPYSDSLADGPVIQDSFNQALAGGCSVARALALVSSVRDSVRCGIVAMVSYSIVHRVGLGAFMRRSAAAGLDGIILPDLPIEEASDAADACQSANLCHVGLVAPTTAPDRRRIIAERSTGFIYQIAVAGTTGERRELDAGVVGQVAELRRLAGLPVCVGFGISQPEHVRAVCRFADGAIVGSAIIRRMTETLRAGGDRRSVVDAAARFMTTLAQAGGRDGR